MDKRYQLSIQDFSAKPSRAPRGGRLARAAPQRGRRPPSGGRCRRRLRGGSTSQIQHEQLAVRARAAGHELLVGCLFFVGQVHVAIAPDVSVVEALRKEGIDILTSCEQGVCGTCLTRVLEGEGGHRDMYLTDEEKAANEQSNPCCSRARGGLAKVWLKNPELIAASAYPSSASSQFHSKLTLPRPCGSCRGRAGL